MANDRVAAGVSVIARFKNNEFNKELQNTTNKWNEFTNAAAEHGSRFAEIGTRLQNTSTGCKQLNSVFGSLGSGIIKISGTLGAASAALGAVSAAVSTVIMGVKTLLSGLKQAAAGILEFARPAMEAEKLKRMWAAVGGTDADLKHLKEMANATAGIDVSTAMSSASAFIRMGDSAADAIDKVKVLANANSYFGGTTDSLGRAIVQIEQLSGKTSGFTGDLNSIANALPGVKNELMKAFGVDSIEAIEKAGYTGKDVVDQMIATYSRLPQLEATTADIIDQLRNNWNEVIASLGDELLPVIKKVSQTMIAFVNVIITKMPEIKKAIKDIWADIENWFKKLQSVYNVLKKIGDILSKINPLKQTTDILGFGAKQLGKVTDRHLSEYGLDFESLKNDTKNQIKKMNGKNDSMRQFADVTAPGKASVTTDAGEGGTSKGNRDEQRVDKLNDIISRLYDNLVETFRKNEEITKENMTNWGRMTSGRNENFAGLVKLVQEDSERRTKAMTDWAVSMKQAWEQEKKEQEMQLQMQNSAYLEQIVQNTGATANALGYSLNYDIPVD